MNKNFRKNPFGDEPQVDPSSYIDPTAVIIGPVVIGKECYIGPHVAIRADEVDASTGKVAPVIIGNQVNLQDGVVIHALAGCEVKVGNQTSLAHRSIIHGPCVIEDGCFIGFNALVFKTTIGKGSMVKHSAVVEGIDIPPGKVVPTGAIITQKEDLNLLTDVNHEQQEFMEEVFHTNIELANGYRKL